MCHLRFMQELAPSLRKKIDQHQGNQICLPRNLNSKFREVAWEGFTLKVQETQCIVQQAVNYWEETRDDIDLLRINKNLSKALSPQDTFISNQNLDDAFILEPEEEAAFRSIIKASN